MEFGNLKIIVHFKYKYLKRFLDILFSSILIFLISPLIILICVAIKLESRGPIIFKQKRIGKNLRHFNCYKFRTMSEEAEDILNQLLSKNPELEKEFLTTQKIKNDPRITNIGRILRKTSLDELPQIINILKGDMHLIGPRPIVDSEKIRYGKYLNEVFSVRPGITGLWQVSGRNKLSYKRRVELDLIYIRNTNFKLDLNIFFRTIGVIILPFDNGAF